MGSWSTDKIFILNLKWKISVVLDNVATHKTSKVKDWIKECETTLSVILSSFTRRLQSLDISINKMLKKVKKYVDYWISKTI